MYFDCKRKDSPLSSYPDCDDEPIAINKLRDDTNDLTFYSDFSLTALCKQFGNKLKKDGISPRVSGLTMNGNEFHCCGGYAY